MDSLGSPYTKRAYGIFYKKFEEFMGSQDIMCGNDAKIIERKIIEFIMYLREKGLSHSAIRNYMMCLISFYKIHDILLNTGKIRKFLPEYQKMKEDRGYTHKEIQKLLNIADERMRAVILILASTGIRIGALVSLKVKDVQENKITVYRGSREQYFTFVTPECKIAIDEYLDMRSRYGEKINDDSPIIREQFDVRVSSKKARHVDETSLYGKLRDLSIRSGVRDKNLPICHGFRKFFTTQLIEADVQYEARLKLEGHSIGITDHYWTLTDRSPKLYVEYQKALNNLTINPENRLKAKVETLEREKTNYDFLNERMDEMQKNWVQIFDMIYKNKTPEQIKEMQESYERTIGKLDFTISQKNDK